MLWSTAFSLNLFKVDSHLSAKYLFTLPEVIKW